MSPALILLLALILVGYFIGHEVGERYHRQSIQHYYPNIINLADREKRPGDLYLHTIPYGHVHHISVWTGYSWESYTDSTVIMELKHDELTTLNQ
jgi:hypothetical protein